MIQQVLNGLVFSTGYYYQSELRVLDAIATQTTMRGNNIRIAGCFGNLVQSGGGEAALVVQNVFQDNYTEYFNTVELGNLLFGRRAYITPKIYF